MASGFVFNIFNQKIDILLMKITNRNHSFKGTPHLIVIHLIVFTAKKIIIIYNVYHLFNKILYEIYRASAPFPGFNISHYHCCYSTDINC